MRKLTLLIIGLMLVSFGCARIPKSGIIAKPSRKERERIVRMNERNMEDKVKFSQRLKGIKERTQRNGYITLEGLDTFLKAPAFIKYKENRARLIPNYKGFGWESINPIIETIYEMFDGNYVRRLVDEDKLPFKAMFYLAIENEDYDKAEIIRRSWVGKLKEIKQALAGRGYTVSQSIEYRLEKLTSVVGLTDPMLIKLRGALAKSMAEEDWDSVQKLQSIIKDRVAELRPSRPQVIYKELPGGKTTVVVQQPSEQRIKVEQVPKYGAEDVGRAISLLEGKSGLTNQQKGALKLFDMLTGR